MTHPFQAVEEVAVALAAAAVEAEEVEAAAVAVSRSTSFQLTVDALCKYIFLFSLVLGVVDVRINLYGSNLNPNFESSNVPKW